MTYRRRYLSGQAATTVVIAEGAITTDKIVDKAVTQPKVADDAVTTDKIAPGAVESSDIQDNTIQTADLKDLAVTTPKIADGAVTTQKLEASIQGIARPLTPGVSSAEIAADAVIAAKIAADAVETAKIKNGNVTAGKLAADSVETVKIKDGAVTTAKIAGGAVDATKIGVGAVTGSEILNGSVGVTELAANAVETVKVKDLNITLSKLAPDSVDSSKILDDAVVPSKIPDDSILPVKIQVPALSLAKDKEMNRFFDDFMGNALSSAWRASGAAGFSVLPSVDSCFELKTGALISDDVILDWGGNLGGGKIGTVLPGLFVGLRDRVGVTKLTSIVALWGDGNNYIGFEAKSINGEVPLWKAMGRKGGLLTEVATGIPVSTGIQTMEIVTVAVDDIAFFINGAHVADITNSVYIPNVNVEPYIRLIAKEAVQKSVKVDFVSLLQSRETP